MTPLLERLLDSGSCCVGELTLRRDGACIVVLGPDNGKRPVEAPEDPEDFRQWIRETDTGRYRPLSGERSLRVGWVKTCADIAAATAVVDVVYPLALVHLARSMAGRLRITSLDDAVARQRGLYRAAARLGPEGRAAARAVLCEDCVREPVWDGSGRGGERDGIPCPEPCGIYLALCGAAVSWEDHAPACATVDFAARFAEFEAKGNPVRERYLRQRFRQKR